MQKKALTSKPAMNNNFYTDDDDSFQAKIDYATKGYTCKIRLGSRPSDTELSTKEKPCRIYVAGPWFDDRSQKLYDAIVWICNRYKQPYMEFFFPREHYSETPMDAYKLNVKNIRKCDEVIALVHTKDSGTAWEIGMATALRKKITMVGYDSSSFLSHTNVMLAFSGKPITLAKLADHIYNGDYGEDNSSMVDIPNTWEGKE